MSISTNEKSAINRSLKFELSTITDPEKTYKILDLEPNSYYKIILKEDTVTTILEVLNNKFYTICTSEEKYVKLVTVNNMTSLYIKNFRTPTCFIDFYEQFNLKVEEETEVTFSNDDVYNTNGVIKYISKLLVNDVSAATLKVDSTDITTLECEAIKMGNWRVSLNNGKVSFKITS